MTRLIPRNFIEVGEILRSSADEVSDPSLRKVTLRHLLLVRIQGRVYQDQLKLFPFWGAFDSAKNHKRQRRKRQSVTAKPEKSQTPKFV